MQIPFKFRKIPKYDYDQDGRFPKDKITGRDKRRERRRHIKRYFTKEDLKD